MGTQRLLAHIGLGTLLATLVLVCSLRSRDERLAAHAPPREFRVQRAPTTPTISSRNSDEARQPNSNDQLSVALRQALDRAAHEGEVSEPELAKLLLDALNRQDIGVPALREAAARATAAEVASAADAFRGTHTGSREMRRRALRQQTATLVRALHEATAPEEERRPRTFGPRPEGYRRLPWEELTGFGFQEGAPLPQRVLGLDQEQVAMAGYLVEGAPDEFLLVKSIWGCCFGEPPDVTEAVVVTVDGTTPNAWFEGVIRVVGTLEVGPQYEDGYLLSIYRMRALQLDPLR